MLILEFTKPDMFNTDLAYKYETLLVWHMCDSFGVTYAGLF